LSSGSMPIMFSSLCCIFIVDECMYYNTLSTSKYVIYFTTDTTLRGHEDDNWRMVH
jgi:hypothetical protein